MAFFQDNLDKPAQER